MFLKLDYVFTPLSPLLPLSFFFFVRGGVRNFIFSFSPYFIRHTCWFNYFSFK